MAVFDELAIDLAGSPGLAEATLEVAFIDLADGGAFNGNRHGDGAICLDRGFRVGRASRTHRGANRARDFTYPVTRRSR